jgi:fatty acid desaturase
MEQSLDPGTPWAVFEPNTMTPMSELEPSRSRVPRRVREERAYRLVLATGAFGAIAVIGFILAIAGVIGSGIPLIAAVLAVVCGLLLMRSVRR